MNNLLIFSVVMILFSSNLKAQSIETNIQGLVIKDYQCSTSRFVKGILVNRNSEPFAGSLRVKIIDGENDILWQGVREIKVGGQNGAEFFVAVAVGNCLAPNKVQITLER
jgi:hypothetical protein